MLAGCAEKRNEGTFTLTVDILGSNETSTFTFKDAAFLDVLKQKYDVETKKAVYTEYLKCIGDVCANDEYSWLYFVNGEPTSYGMDSYRMQDGDVVLLSYEKAK